MTTQSETELELTGPDGANPLGFLCALGTLRALTHALPDARVKLAWRQQGARWLPVVKAIGLPDVFTLAQILCDELKRDDVYAPIEWDDTHNLPSANYRSFASDTSNRFLNQPDRREVDWASAIACDAVTNDKGMVEDTAFRTMSGQGHQHFLKQMRLLKTAIKPEHISEALLGWRYQDQKLNLRFDPFDDRRHAMRWKAPKDDLIKSVWGANLLATQGIVLHPAFAVGRRLETTGFRGHREHNTFWTWAMWNVFLDLDVVRSVLAIRELQENEPRIAVLAPFGVIEIFRARRIKVDKFRAFTPAQPM